MEFIKPLFEFFGDKTLPFLAPRGVFIHKNKLLVSDTAQNRICIWNDFTKIQSTHKEPDIIIGDDSYCVSAKTLRYPTSVWTNGKKIIVADSWNHRVLIWQQFPTHSFQKADTVLGQMNFEDNEPNLKGLNAPPSMNSLYWCYGLTVYQNQLFIADTGNRRMVYYKNIPEKSQQTPDKILCQKDPNSRDTNSFFPIWPYSIKISPQGCVAIADTQFYRVLLWQNISAFLQNAPPSTLIGQNSIEENGQNQYHFLPNANTLNWVYDIEFYKNGIIIADTGNSRLLYFESIPSENNAFATKLFGQKNFNVCGENLNISKPDLFSLYWPFHVSIYDDIIAMADTGSQRILIGTLS